MNLLTLYLHICFFLHITQPTRIRDSSETLIDIIFSNTLMENAIPGNSTAIISDHLPQFIILPNSFSNPLSNKQIFMIQKPNIFSVDWNSLINNDKDVNLSFNNFLKKINAILGNYAIL